MESIKEEMVPKRIKKMRIERNMTQKELADLVGVSKSYISRIEHADTAPPVGTMIALAQALNVDFNAFFETEDPTAYLSITRKNKRPAVARDNMASFKYEHLALNYPNRAFEPYVIKDLIYNQPSQPNQHKGEELLFVLKGKIEFNVNNQPYILEEGDSIYFNASYPHHGRCFSESGCELIGIIYNGSKTDEKMNS